MDICGGGSHYSHILHWLLEFPSTFMVRQGHRMSSNLWAVTKKLSFDFACSLLSCHRDHKAMLRWKSHETQAA